MNQQAASLEQQASLARAANTQALANMVSPMNMGLAMNAELNELMLRGAKRFGNVPKKNVEEDRYTNVLAAYLIVYENMYTQHQKKLLDDDVYAGWDQDLKKFVHREALENYWDDWKDSYQAAFSQYVSGLVTAKKAEKPRSVP